MRGAAALLAFGFATLAAKAETVHIVDDEDIVYCDNLSSLIESYAVLKHDGMAANGMRNAMLNGDVEPKIADLIVGMIYSFDANETQTYRSVAASFCILDRLKPLQIER